MGTPFDIIERGALDGDVMRHVLCAVVLLSAGGCSRVVSEVRVQTVRVETLPPGLQVEQIDRQGHRIVGPSPVTVEKRYDVRVKYFQHWNWVWPALFGLCSGVGFGMMGEGGDEPPPGLIAGGLCLLGFLPTFITNTVLAARSGRVVSTETEPVRFQAYSPQVGWGTQQVDIPGPVGQIKLVPRPGPPRRVARRPAARPPAPAPGPSPAPAPRPAPTPLPASARARPIVAVFEVEDGSGKLSAEVLGQLTDYLAAKLTEVAGYRVIPRRLIRARLVESKTEGYKQCYDEACQIELGRALSAQKSLATRLIQVGSSCALSATLYDLKSETTEKATSVRTNCTEDALMDGMEQIARKLR